MRAMGLVPWVSSPGWGYAASVDQSQNQRVQRRPLEADDPTKFEPDVLDHQVQLEQGANEGQVQFKQGSVGGSLSEIPLQLDRLSRWLLNQRLCPHGIRGGNEFIAGAINAPLLVVVVQDPQKSSGEVNNQQSLFSVDGAKLFDLMLRSIGLNRNQISLCRLDNVLPTQLSSEPIPPHLNSDRKAVLLLIDSVHDVFDSTAVEQHKGLIVEGNLPFWRISHPEILLRTGHLKRQAWNALKDINQVLSA